MIKEEYSRRKQKNDLRLVRQALTPYREQIKGIVVESTYNWYWLDVTIFTGN